MGRFRWIPPSERGPDGKDWIEIDEIMSDPNSGLNGPVWCPEGGYYDRALQRRFENKEEKRAYMREKGLKMEGSSKNYKGVQAEGPGKRYYSYGGVDRCSRGYKAR